jgi:uracil-DNA glycosylase family 4
MTDRLRDDRLQLIREFRQRLEALARAGVDRIPAPVLPAGPPRRASVPPTATPPPTTAVQPAREGPPRAPEPPRRPDAPAATRPPAPAATRPPAAPPVLAASLFGEESLAVSPVDPSERPAQLAALAAEVADCQRCPQLAATRTRTVFGTGSPTARLFFVGEAPGADEDRTGQPFVGRAGQLLTDMITKGMGLTRDEVYIANILKSRPPENRTPLPDEVGHCLPYLERQIAIIRPEFLCLLGATAAQALLETALSVGRLRGRWHRYRGIPTLVTYHPSYLLRNPPAKKDAWEDLQILMQAMGLKQPDRKKG